MNAHLLSTHFSDTLGYSVTEEISPDRWADSIGYGITTDRESARIVSLDHLMEALQKANIELDALLESPEPESEAS